MNGKIVAGFIVITGLVAGIAMYWLQVYAYYDPVSFTPGQEITLVPIEGDAPEAIVVADITGIDASSSPLRFRACFTTPLTQATLTETYRLYEKPVPLNAPGWFGCFNADEIGEALERGEALAFLSRHDIAPGVDRVVAVYPDGRAYAWHQLNAEAGQ
ncbi:MAG: histidine kinase [Cereibacter sphaeroides]|uniref:Histidine kinase n=1 Tax=Cereibacter sphaeroides TaxID=1063 RepID=A0A2W5TVZ3_CERSP|nr:MAG: histidine kinase [Cereibacter sphaeroides]